VNVKKFTILHSNDMHGDFLAEARAGETKMMGGLSLLSGYINKVRREEENVLYVIAGDMVQGSLIDSEYKGVSTMGLMNYLAPDVVSLGNHEFDYGLSHLLFLEKVANFPIVNANLYIKPYSKRLMRPYLILPKAGFDILFTGIITEKVMDTLKMDPLLSSFVTLQDAAAEIGKICNAYKNDDIDLTIILTHIGYDSDVELAGLLKPEWGVDMIIGGHSHTILEKPGAKNGVLIAQAGVGTDQIGRFDISVDDDTNSIIEYKWSLIPIVEGIAEPDEQLTKYLATYQQEVDQKYNAIVCKLAIEHTHPQRETETSLGNLIADAFAENAECHAMLVASGSIRTKKLGPLVTMRDLLTCFPYNDILTRYTITGDQLTRLFQHIMRNENRNGEGECYQVNSRVNARYNDVQKLLVSLQIDGEDVDAKKLYTICLQNYHAKNSQAYLNISPDELNAGKTKVVSTSSFEVLEEYLKRNQNISRRVEGRLVYE
jgi:5'-nucleotidase / UDP-sugar diphosphatase